MITPESSRIRNWAKMDYRSRRPTIPNPHESSFEKAKNLAAQLKIQLAPFHEPAPCRPKRTSVIRELQLREIGSDKHRPSRIMPELLENGDREYIADNMISYKNRVKFNDQLLVSTNEGLLDVHTREELPYHREGGATSVHFIDCIICTSDYMAQDGRISPAWVITLSIRGIIYIYDHSSGQLELKHRILLPCNLYKFRSLEWNRKDEEFYVIGESLRHIDDDIVLEGRNARGESFVQKNYAIACFETAPLRFRCMVKLEKAKFSNFYAFVLLNDMLIAFCTRPRKLVIYDFGDLYRNYCMKVYDPYDLIDTGEIVPFNVNVNGPVKILLDVNGNYESIDFGGDPLYILLEPGSMTEHYRLCRADNHQVDAVSQSGFRLRAPTEGCVFGLEFSSTLFHPDHSNRILRFEGIHLACYTLSSMIGSHQSEVKPMWRTAFLPRQQTNTAGIWYTRGGAYSSGEDRGTRRRSAMYAPPARDFDSAVMVRAISYEIEGVLGVLVAYDISSDALNSQSSSAHSVYAELPEEWVSLLYMIDSECGRIIRIVPLDNQAPRMNAYNAMESTYLNDDVLISSFYDRHITNLRIYRLTDLRQETWKSETARHSKYQTAQLSRKQRRKQQQALRQQALKEIEEMRNEKARLYKRNDLKAVARLNSQLAQKIAKVAPKRRREQPVALEDEPGPSESADQEGNTDMASGSGERLPGEPSVVPPETPPEVAQSEAAPESSQGRRENPMYREVVPGRNPPPYRLRGTPPGTSECWKE